MENIIVQGDYTIVIDNHSTVWTIRYRIYYKGIMLVQGSACTEAEALTKSNEYIESDINLREFVTKLSSNWKDLI